jgi:TIR domain-containing protein
VGRGDQRRYSYDIFISHNRADKEWVRVLTERLTEQPYNGRRLRPWLDEHFLDPGNLASNAELTTAMDRSRFFGLVMSPEAMVSAWVDFEVRHFLNGRDRAAIIPMLRRNCAPPEALRGLPAVDFRGDGLGQSPLDLLIANLCTASEVSVEDVNHGIDAAWERVELSDPGGFSADPSPARDALFDVLTLHDIDDAVTEGFAVAAFDHAAERLLRLHATGGDALYNGKMLLGECLAAALHRSPGYRQIAQRFLDRAEAQADGLTLLFVVARAYSKLAEIDIRLVDLSVLLRASSQLDAKPLITNEDKAIEALLGRTIGKIRGKPAGELMIKTLSESGRSSRVIAAGAISLSVERSAPVFYLSELARQHERRAHPPVIPNAAPSRKLLGQLFALDLDQDESVRSALRLAKQDLERDFPGIDFPYPALWALRKGIEVGHPHNAPFMGTIVKATLSNMVELVDTLDVSSVACLTEPRIVDALFDHCGAVLILRQDPDSPQCRRLRDRGVPFGMLSQEVMSELSDGDHVVVDKQQLSRSRS